MALAVLDQLLEKIETNVKASSSLSPELLSDLVEKDRPIVTAALQHRCDILLTGDKTRFGARNEPQRLANLFACKFGSLDSAFVV